MTVLIGDETRDQFDGIAKKDIMLILARCHALHSKKTGFGFIAGDQP